MRCNAAVARIDATGGRVRAVELETGERIPAQNVVTAIHPATALLELLDPPLGGTVGAQLAATHRSNTVQMLVHVAVDRLPAYTNGLAGDHHGLQSYVDELSSLSTAFRAAEDRRIHLPVPAYVFTTSALDRGLAPASHHTMYLACPAAPSDVDGGWERAAPQVVESMLDQVETRAPDGPRRHARPARIAAPDRGARVASHADRRAVSVARAPRRPAVSPAPPAEQQPRRSGAHQARAAAAKARAVVVFERYIGGARRPRGPRRLVAVRQ